MMTMSTMGEKGEVGIDEANVTISHLVKRAHGLLDSRQ